SAGGLEVTFRWKCDGRRRAALELRRRTRLSARVIDSRPAGPEQRPHRRARAHLGVVGQRPSEGPHGRMWGAWRAGGRCSGNSLLLRGCVATGAIAAHLARPEAPRLAPWRVRARRGADEPTDRAQPRDLPDREPEPLNG